MKTGLYPRFKYIMGTLWVHCGYIVVAVLLLVVVLVVVVKNKNKKNETKLNEKKKHQYPKSMAEANGGNT